MYKVIVKSIGILGIYIFVGQLKKKILIFSQIYWIFLK